MNSIKYENVDYEGHSQDILRIHAKMYIDRLLNVNETDYCVILGRIICPSVSVVENPSNKFKTYKSSRVDSLSADLIRSGSKTLSRKLYKLILLILRARINSSGINKIINCFIQKL